MTRALAIALILCAFTLSGCSAFQEKTTIDTTKNFRTPKEGYAGIYFYRWTFIGFEADTDIVLDGGKLADIDSGEYYYLELPRGAYTLLMFQDVVMPDIEKEYSFEPGRNYFFRGLSKTTYEGLMEITSDDEIIDAQNHIKNDYTRVYE